MPIRLPIKFIKDQDPETDPAELGRPVILITIVQPGSVGADGECKVDTYWALVDTGADPCAIEKHVLATHAFPQLKSGNLIGATAAAAADRYEVQFLVGDVGIKIPVYELDSRHDREKPYPILLGNTFLQRGVLHMDYVNLEFWFDFYPETERRKI
jgi:hypothetical protein